MKDDIASFPAVEIAVSQGNPYLSQDKRLELLNATENKLWAIQKAARREKSFTEQSENCRTIWANY